MKHGFRKPSLKKSIASRTIGKAKRELMRSIIPGYGTRNSSIFNPKKKLYNKIYSKTTFGINDINKIYNKNITQTKSSVSKTNYSSFSELNIDSSNPNFSYYKTVVKEIEKLTKTNDVIYFFVNLKGIYQYIESLKSFEIKYGGGNYLSEKLIIFMNNKRSKLISDFIERKYENMKSKVIQLKTVNSKKNNVDKFLIEFNSFKSELNEEHLTRINECYNLLKNLLD